MGLPEPVLSFTIPSIHDDTALDYRVYHPTTLTDAFYLTAHEWRKSGTIIAHPYAPLGGCYDDPVVGSVAAELLDAGLIVGLFNFRGAGSSKGHTSWSGKAELNDYISFAGFFVHYLRALRPMRASSLPLAPSSSLSPVVSTEPTARVAGALANHTSDDDGNVNLILGGYSYGSLITTHLPPTDDILSRFANPAEGTAAAEILLRAKSLTAQSNLEIASELENARGRERGHSSRRVSNHNQRITVGGEETPADVRRRSRDARRSVEVMRSLDIPRKLKERRRKSGEDARHELHRQQSVAVISGVTTCYLLVSPTLPPVSTFLAVSMGSAKGKEALDKLATHPTLAVYGDKDGFTSIKKLRAWAQRIGGLPQSRFRGEAVEGAGHFWREPGVETKLREALRKWLVDAGMDRV